MSSGVVNDDLVAQFLSVTGSSDPATATNYLEMSGGNMETAIGLYMEHNNGGGMSGGAGGGGNGMDDGMAAAAAAAAAMEGDDIRAPDETRTMRLMDDHGHGGAHHSMMGMMAAMGGASGDPSFRMMQEMMDEQLQRSAFADDSAARPPRARDAVDRAASQEERQQQRQSQQQQNDNDSDDGNYQQEYQYDDDDDEDDDVQMQDNDDDDDAQAAAVRAQGLQDMFAAPTHLMHKAGGFAGARQMAKDSKRWLLVNIQKDDEFSSHALNRDVWRNDLVENLIREGFIFWQEMDVSPEGQQFVQRYRVGAFPHLSIIDPRTGRLLWKREGWTQQDPVTAERFAEMAMDFCSRNSLDRPPTAPERPRGSNGPPARTSSSVSNKSIHELSEQEQLEAAMQASLQENGGNTNKNNGSSNNSVAKSASSMDDDDDEVKFLGHSAQDAVAAVAAAAPKSPLDEWLALEVPPDAGAVKISFRLPNGRVVRCFDGSHLVEAVYAFIAHHLEKDNPEKKEFVVMAGFPPKDLKPFLKDTIDKCSLHGQAVNVRWA